MPLFLYSLYRFLVLVAAFVLLLWAGAHVLLAAALAVVIAFAVSYLFLRGPRDAAATWMAGRVESRRAAKAARGGAGDDDARFEDSVVDEGRDR
ncbi:DUF4229 domain-containing protein [Xylanimonas oleitrophica]|uniref:DUF4229 domain-containing protein n=1 Tax=Xylanimonas oleitrophica TaxID=2607479 RepID=UPI001FECD388|nr:DUF4229 domain-containing protein [Xylanimonas oleitrophica]